MHIYITKYIVKKAAKKTQTKGAIECQAAGLGEGVSLEPRAGAPETRGEA